MAQVVEHVLGKDEVTSSNLVSSSKQSIVFSDTVLFGFYVTSSVRRECGGGLGRSPIVIFRAPRKRNACVGNGHQFEAG